MNNNIVKWDVLNIGHLTRNRFWGEDESHAYRQTVCTSTLLRTGDKNIIVDPSLPPDEMSTLLFDRSGLKCDDIDIVYITHLHGDHFAGAKAFPKAQWVMAEEDLKTLCSANDDKMQYLTSRTISVGKELVPGINSICLPGHTMGLTGLIFNAAEGTVIIAGDSVMTRDFFYARQGYFNVVDKQASTNSIDRIAESADIVVPGHDNYFLINNSLLSKH